ncbi:actinia tenebrosa protease inhibitors-like [Oratosquilla oratoria]|uniref:actinia tenebrosa protease inhibitors-like n=1 Tax=Oratosquilla oratoria TaxID=337810 RepID=UPI003F77325A
MIFKNLYRMKIYIIHLCLFLVYGCTWSLSQSQPVFQGQEQKMKAQHIFHGQTKGKENDTTFVGQSEQTKSQVFFGQQNQTQSTRPRFCTLPPNPGDCRGAFPRYFYNAALDQCDCFLHGGCNIEGLENSFMTLVECIDSCSPSNQQRGEKCRFS